MAEARFDRVTKRFGDATALHELSLTAEDGEFVVLVGPSGCGKTTALRCLAGLEEPDEGRVFIGDEDITWVEPKDRDVAMVFQNYALYPYMTVFDNMGFPMKMRKAPKDAIRRRVGEVAELLDIAELLDRKPRELSGGQQQRVALGRAIVRQPAVFLMDEPLSNLDARLRAQTRTELSKLHRQLGTTTIYVTHDQVEAMTMGSRIAVMREGRLLQVAPPLEIYRKPIDTFVASFIGSPPMNLISAQVDGPSDRIVTAFGAIRLDDGQRLALDGAEDVIVGARPEHFEIAPETSTHNGANVLAVEVQVVEELGSDLYVYADPGPLAARIEPDVRVVPGDVLRLRLRNQHLHLFDVANGKRIEIDPR